MAKVKLNNLYDVVYKTKSGRAMIAKNISAKNVSEAKTKVKQQMRLSSSFNGVVTAIKL